MIEIVPLHPSLGRRKSKMGVVFLRLSDLPGPVSYFIKSKKELNLKYQYATCSLVIRALSRGTFSTSRVEYFGKIEWTLHVHKAKAEDRSSFCT